MKIETNTPELYLKKIDLLKEQLECASSSIIKEEIKKSLIMTDVAIAAFVDLQKSLSLLPEIYKAKDVAIQDRLASIANEMKRVCDLDIQLDSDIRSLSFSYLNIEAGGLFNSQDANMTIMKIILEIGIMWVNVLNYTFKNEDAALTRRKIAFLAKVIGGQIPFLSNAIEAISLVADAISINTKDVKTSDSFINGLQAYNTSLNLYVYGCISFRLDAMSIMNSQAILTDEEKKLEIQEHYKSVIKGEHYLFSSKNPI
ncbi:hypothetical protein AAIK96_000828 [Klebsiella pneumoniae]|uniref:Uncharacterized protein n=1 Tax=Klebsiella pneumoniae TaxID=573 RepID=A0A486T315_KLEPN|nr:Uncharacterised protein [Klebsiella pneumoniae]HBW7470847.1 hypothetical protein [Klebsiella pneumoniae]